MIDMMAFGAYNNLMPKPLQTEFDWLSRQRRFPTSRPCVRACVEAWLTGLRGVAYGDEKEVDSYINGGCGFPMSLKFWQDFLPYLQLLKVLMYVQW